MLDFSKLTPTNHAVQSLRELIALSTFKGEQLENIVTVMSGVVHGDRLGFIGDMSRVGKKGGGCDPSYTTAAISSAEKVWALGKWEIPLKLCYEALEGTIAEYCLNEGTAIQDLTSTEYMTVIVEPALEKAMIEMVWRMGWFGDTAAKNIADSGNITAGVDTALLTTCDGLFKRLFAIGAGAASQKSAIAANAEATYALQKSVLLGSGVATGLFETIRMDADSRIASLDGAGIFCTKSLADALQYDIKRTYKTNLPWEKIFTGFEMTEWDGVTIYKVSNWDRMIKEYEDNGTKLNLPHRAVYSAPSNLLVGTSGAQPISDLSIKFDDITRNNYIYSTGKLGTLVQEDAMVHVAY